MSHLRASANGQLMFQKAAIGKETLRRRDWVGRHADLYESSLSSSMGTAQFRRIMGSLPVDAVDDDEEMLNHFDALGKSLANPLCVPVLSSDHSALFYRTTSGTAYSRHMNMAATYSRATPVIYEPTRRNRPQTRDSFREGQLANGHKIHMTLQ